MMFQLRYLQTLNSISAENNSTIVFPVPIDIMSSFMPPATGDVSILYLIWNDGMHHFIPQSHLLLWMCKMQNISPVVTNFLMFIQGTILETCCKLQGDLNSIFLSPHVTVAFALLFCRWQAIRRLFSTSESKSDNKYIYRWTSGASSQHPSQDLSGINTGERKKGVNPGK